MTFIFGHPGPGQACQASGWPQIKKLHITKVSYNLILVRVSFKKKSWNPKFLLPGRPALPCSPIISGQGLKIKIPLPTNSSFRRPDSKKVWHYPPNPKSKEEIDLTETAVLQPRAGTGQPAVPNYLPKNYLRGVLVSLKISCKSITWFKSYCIC